MAASGAKRALATVANSHNERFMECPLGETAHVEHLRHSFLQLKGRGIAGRRLATKAAISFLAHQSVRLAPTMDSFSASS